MIDPKNFRRCIGLINDLGSVVKVYLMIGKILGF